MTEEILSNVPFCCFKRGEKMKQVAIVLFDNFETLDVFGPVELLGRLPEAYSLEYYSMKGGMVTSGQGTKIVTEPFCEITSKGILLIPGGQGTRSLVDDSEFIEKLGKLAYKAEYIFTVCTGAALLAKTGRLNGKEATSNKRAFQWVQSINEQVHWVKKARWVIDKNIYSSSGVSAGMDMTLGFLCDVHGEETVKEVCQGVEYTWNRDKENDPFAR